MKDELYILWTNDNLITSEKMVFLYAKNAKIKNWFDSVNLIIWGATAKLAAEDSGTGLKITEMIEAGVEVTACKACADQLGVSEKLTALGVDVKYMGEPLTMILKEKKTLLTV